MQRKGKIKYDIRNRLHSIPIMNVKSNAVYSIPVCMLALYSGLFSPISIFSNNAYADTGAWVDDGVATDKSSITSISSGTSTPPTVSLSLSKPSMVSDIATPGSIATVSTGVTVDVKNADSYTLTLAVDNTTMTSGNTTISAGNVVNDNTWGYKWDGAANYTAPSTTGISLTVPAVDSNNSSSFTKNLIFGVKFASDADAGHYKASGKLSLVANPRTTVITLADLTQMQQLSLPKAARACENTPYLSGQNYSAEFRFTDVRDNSTYTVRKLGDGKCWMTQNLQLSNIGSTNDGTPVTYTGGRTLNSTTSNIPASTWILPASDASNFNAKNDTQATYLGTDSKGIATGYYSWCAATAGFCSNASVNYDICPRGWRLPTGGVSSSTDFYNLFRTMGLTISDSLATPSSTAISWQPSDLAKAQNQTYNFAYTGIAYNGSYSAPTNSTRGYWWSNKGYSNYGAYVMLLDSEFIYPGSVIHERYYGYAIRCVAANS